MCIRAQDYCTRLQKDSTSFNNFVNSCSEILLNPTDDIQRIGTLMLLERVVKKVGNHFEDLKEMNSIMRHVHMKAPGPEL